MVILSVGDRNNNLLNQIANIIENSDLTKDAIPITEFVSSSNFPNNSIGKVVQIKDTIGRVSGISEDGTSLCLLNFKTGQTTKFKLTMLQQNFQKTGNSIKPTSAENNTNVHSTNRSSPTSIARLITKGNFPESALGQLVQFQDVVGHIWAVPGNGQTFVIKEVPSGQMLIFNTYEVIKRVSETSLEKKTTQDKPSNDHRPSKTFVVQNKSERSNNNFTNNITKTTTIAPTVKQTETQSVTALGAKVADISNFIYKPNFPRCAMGQLIQIGNKAGKIIKISADEQTFTFQDYKTGQKHIYDVIQTMTSYGKK